MANQLQCVLDYEKHSVPLLPKKIYDYYRGGSSQEETLTANRSAFKRWRIVPRVLKPVTEPRCTETTILGEKLKVPFGIAPVGIQRMAHYHGECASAKAAADMGMLFILATISNSSIEEVAKAAPRVTKWFQAFFCKDRNVTLKLVRRAEASGFKAIVFTVDCCVPGLKLADKRNNFTLPEHLKIANVDWAANNPTASTKSDGPRNLLQYGDMFFDVRQSWEDVAWIQKHTQLPIVLKGILSPEDAEIAVQHGVAGIIVSNHGGRQLDGVTSTLDALPAIVERVRGRCEIYMDGGITQGTDIFKALALGAKMVFIGRPVVWGLAVNGENGVKEICRILKKELDTALVLTGCSSVADIREELLQRQGILASL